MRILLFLLLLSPVFASAQILRAYGVIEVGSLPTSSATGPKFAYRPADSSFYRWVSGSTWVKIIPDEPDTLYLKQISGTTALVDGDTIDISTYFLKSDTTSAFASYLKRPVGWGLSLLTGKYPFVDSSKVASRYYVSTSPTTIAANYIATSNGTNLVARNLFDNNTYVGILNSKPFQLGQWTTAGRPSGTAGYMGWRDGTTFEWHNGTRWAAGLESTAPTFTAGSLIFANTNGQADQDNTQLFWDNTNNRLGIGTNAPASGYSLDVNGNGRFQGVAFRAGNNGFQVYNPGSGTADYTMLNSASSGNTILSINSAGAGTTAAIYFKPNNTTVGQFSASSTEFTIQHNSNVVRMLGGSGASPTEIRIATSGVGLSLAGTGATPSYVLDIVGTNAVRFPRGTTAQTPTEAAGILRWNTDTIAFQGYTGAARFYLADRTWVRSTLTSSLGGYWSTAGNTSGSSKFLGTTDASPLNLRTNNRNRLVISSAGTVSINTASTSARLNLADTTSTSSIGLQSANYVTFTSNNAGSIFGSSNNINLNGAFTYNSSGGLTSGVDGSSYNGTIFHDGTGLAGTLINFRAGIRTTSTGNITNAIGFYSSVRNASDTIANHYALYYGGYDATTTGRVLHSYVVYGGENGATTNHVDPWGVYIPNPAQKNLFGGLMTFSGYGTGTKTATALSKTESSYAAWLMTDGTVGEKSLSTIRDGNGIYSNSATLANHTTRARVPANGNLFFSQTYNSTDSAYVQVINNLDGNREVRVGLTDTVTTGYSNFRVYQDGDNEVMGWEAITEDGLGNTTVRGEGGSLSVYADNALEMRGTEIRLNNGEVLMNQYGQGNMKSSDLGATDSKFVAKFSDGGKILDYYLARDTFIEDVTLFSVGTLMNDCQELTIVSSMTATAPSHQEIRFPDAGDHLRGKKIIVYQKKKEAGIYVPQIKVVGGVSRLYFTTNTLTTDPSDQSVLSMDDVTWYTHGVTYEFTCLRIDNTPSYRWVLKQR